ncbi:MAG: hypothetical protein H7177_06185 [Rhizobacter sp.]|nr:hypothetical protein [Bacteriovorax sp.]
MDYVSGPIILYSQDKIRMMDFLSDVFEFDVDPEQDLVTSGALNIKLVELHQDEKKGFHTTGVTFAFKLKNIDDIKEIVNKYNFFLYRKEDKTYSEEICNMDQPNEKSLSIKDIDGRVWQFDVETMQ